MLYLILKLLHVAVAFWFVGGVIGRALTFAQARKETDIHTTATLLQLSERFERTMVIPGSSAVLLLGLLTAWQLPLPLFGFLQNFPSNWLLTSLVLYLVMMVNVFVVLAPRRKQRRQAATDALSEGVITPALIAALNDSAVIQARRVEYVLLIAIIMLMVLKPF